MWFRGLHLWLMAYTHRTCERGARGERLRVSKGLCTTLDWDDYKCATRPLVLLSIGSWSWSGMTSW